MEEYTHLSTDMGPLTGPPIYAGLKCYTDGSWKDTDVAFSIGWIAFQGEDTVSIWVSEIQDEAYPIYTQK